MNIKKLIEFTVSTGLTNRIDDVLQEFPKFKCVSIEVKDYALNIENSLCMSTYIKGGDHIIEVYSAIDKTSKNLVQEYQWIIVRDLDLGTRESYDISVTDCDIVILLKEVLKRLC